MREGEGTKFTIDRKIFSSDIWFSSPWKLKIWLYLVGKANHTDGSFMGIKIKRGQLIRSLRTIQKECSYMIGYRVKKPSLSTVRRICEELTKDARIEQRTVHCGTLFTICNYNDLQPMEKVRKEQRTNGLRNNGETVGEQNKNVKNVKNDKKKTYQKIYDFYVSEINPKQKSKTRALKNIERWHKKHSYDDLIQAIKNYQSVCNGRDSEHKKDPANFFGVNEVFHIDYLSENFIKTDTAPQAIQAGDTSIYDN